MAKWLNGVNKLKLNLKKTKYMVIAKSEKDEYNIKKNGETIERTCVMKYLGMMIDWNMKMKSHNDYIM